MPEIQTVGDRAEPAQRRGGEEAPGRCAGSPGQARDEQGGGQGVEEQPAPEEGGGVLAVGRDPVRPDARRQGEAPPARRAFAEAGDQTRGGLGGRQRSEQEREGAGVGALVDPGGVGRRGEDDHQDQGRGGPGRGHGGHPPSAAPATGRQAEHQRPHHVELLLDRDAPQMAEDPGAGRVPVADPVGHEVPVGKVRGHPRSVVEGVPEQVRRAEGPHQEQGPGEHDRERRQQPPRAPAPEGEQVDPAVTGPRLLQQQARDEEAGQDEEEVDAEEPAVEMTGVEEQHAQDGDAAQAVERGDVPP